MLRLVTLMDLHWGAISPERMEMEISQTLYPFLDENNIDVIIIAGDLFDSKQYLTSEVTKHVIRFIHTLMMKCKTLVFLTGTKTHDDLQLDTLKEIYSEITSICDTSCAIPYFMDKVGIINFKDICGVSCSSMLSHNEFDCIQHDDISILCVPEEYILDQDEYYRPYLDNKHYDLIIYHGMVDKIWYAKKNKESQTEFTKHSSAPVFKVDEILEHCDKCYAGHVHMHKHYGNDGRFLYVGPYTRWEFGKDGDVGFQYVEINKESKKITDRFIVNHNAQVMSTRVLNINETVLLKDLNVNLDNIIKEEMNYSDKLRFIININSSIDNYLGIKDFIISKLGEMKFIKLILSIDMDDGVMDNTKELIDSTQQEQRKYLYENISMEERIQRFLKSKKNVDIHVDDIKRILTMEV